MTVMTLTEAVASGLITPEEAEELAGPSQEELDEMERELDYQKRRGAEAWWREGRPYAREVYPPAESVF